MNFRISAIIVLALATIAAAPAKHNLSALKTRAQRTGYMETSRYEDVRAFLEAVAEASPRIHLTTFGYSFEGRALPLAIVGKVADATPEAVKASGKTRVYIQANIHAGEVEGKEAALELLRAIASGEHAGWLDSMVLLIAPIYNADGNERVNLTNRPEQHGPVGGMGQRPNAQGLDLNRDHMKLDSPEARSLAGLFNRYDPHLAIDLHTTDGTRHAYHLTYEPPLHPNTPAGIVQFLRKELLPEVTRVIKAHEGWDLYYYGNVPGRNWRMERGWYISDHLPRFNNNYIGLRNRPAILSEAYAYLTFEERIRATRRFVEEILNFAQGRGDRIRQLVKDADAASVVDTDLALRAELERSPALAEILMGETAEERNPYTGAVMLRRLDVRKPEMMPEFISFRGTETARAPAFYLVPSSLTKVLDRLQAHGIRVAPLKAAAVVKVERFRITRSTAAERTYQGHNERTLEGSWEAAEIEVPAGTVSVPVAQPLGRLAFSLLEPRSDDSLATWNLMDEALKDAEFYPVTKTFSALAGSQR
jgi:hypothetical protein